MGPLSPLLSVVIPAFNHAQFIGEALDSIRAQTLGPEEVVVVDDGSTDGTADAVERASWDRVRLVRQGNRGAHDALNTAFSLTTTPWVAILNSDDAFTTTHLEHALGATRATGALFVTGGVVLVGESGEPLPPEHPTAVWYRKAETTAREAGTLRQALERHNVVMTTSNFFLHRDLWTRLRGFRSYRYVHDLDFLLRALALAPERVVYDPALRGVCYRVHAGNTITEDQDRALTERASMLRERRRLHARIRTVMDRVGLVRRGSPPSMSGAPRTEPASRLGAGSTPGSEPASQSGLSPDSGSPRRCGLVVHSLDEGGLEEVVALLATELPRTGLETHVLCTVSGGRVARRLRDLGASVTVAPTARARSAWLERVRPTVLSTHFADRGTLEEFASRGLPIIETVHNTYAWFSPDAWATEREKQPFLTGVVAVSDLAARCYRNQVGRSVAPVTVISNGVQADRVCTVPRDFARKQLGLAMDRVVLVNLSRVTPEKNQAGLLAAFQTMAERRDDVVLVLSGAVTNAAYAQALQRKHDRLFKEGRVRMLAPRRDVGTLLSAADLFVSNSWFEGWSLSATEALWCGVPVILSETGGSRELVGEGGARGRLVPSPSGDAEPSTLSDLMNPEPEAEAKNQAALLDALEDMVERLAEWAALRPDIQSHARTHHGAGPMASAYAHVMSNAAR